MKEIEILEDDINNNKQQNNILTARMQQRRQWRHHCVYNSTMRTISLIQRRRRLCHGRQIIHLNAMQRAGGWINYLMRVGHVY